MRLLPIAALVTAATVATGCASTVNGTPHGGGGTTAAGHSSAAAATSAVPTPTETAAPTPTPTASSAGRLDSLLITAADIKDPSFQETQYTESTEPAPCTPKAKGTLDQQVPPEQRAGRDLARTADPQALVEEQLKVYDTTITASKALAFAKAGLGCAKGVTYNSDGSTSPITIHGPRDVTGALPSGVDEAYDWTLQSSDLQAEAVAARIGDVLVLLEFATVANADVSKLPDTGSIAARAVQKVIDGH